MGESRTEFELPEKWSIEETGERTWRAWRELDHGPDRLVYHDLASGLVLLGIDLSAIDQRLCSLTPAFTMKPTGALAHAVSLMAAQLASSGIGNPALLASTCQLLSCLGAIDPQTSRLPAAYLQKSQRDLARRLHDSIVADPTATPAVESIAAAHHISAASLRAYFSRMYGSTPAAFARALVMKRAMQLLAEGNAAVSNVALSCGYSNPSKFAAAFKRECGLAPLEFRRQHNLDWDNRS